MGLDNGYGLGIGSLKPGVCTSTTRPASPYDGQMIYETDTDRVLIWNNSAWVQSTGETVAYTPTWTNLTVGNGSNVGTYQLINKFVHVEGKLIFGSTTSITGSAAISTLPINSAMAFHVAGSIVYSDSGVATYFGQPIIVGTDAFYCYISNFSTTYGSEVPVTSTVPFTWGTNDAITWSLNYRIA
jgi:hypothetical protein